MKKAKRKLIEAYLILIEHPECAKVKGNQCFYLREATLWAEEQIERFMPVVEVER